MIDYKKQGKSNKRKGASFELSVRKDLEEKGFIVSKWMNNVKFQVETNDKTFHFGKLVPSKRKFNPFKKVMTIGTGFPDFIAFRVQTGKVTNFIFVEAKSNGYLDKEEKAKVKWYINEYGLPFAVASKDKENKGEINYKYLN